MKFYIIPLILIGLSLVVTSIISISDISESIVGKCYIDWRDTDNYYEIISVHEYGFSVQPYKYSSKSNHKKGENILYIPRSLLQRKYNHIDCIHKFRNGKKEKYPGY